MRLLFFALLLASCTPSHLHRTPLGPTTTYPGELVEYSQPFIAGGLAGRVTDVTGAAIPGANVELVGKDWQVYARDVTDEEGHFDLGVTKRGTYRLKIGREAMKPIDVKVRVRKGKPGLRFELEPAM